MFTRKIFKHGKVYKVSNVFLNKKKVIYSMKKVLKNRKAMAALQAAILTGISIAVALIVGYWIWTVVVGSIRTERLQLSIPYAKYQSSLFSNNGGWNITIKVMNKGPSDSTITDVRINGVSYSEWSSDTIKFGTNSGFDSTDLNGGGYTLTAGGEVTVLIEIKKGGSFKSGQTIELAFVTAANQVYTASVSLP